MSVTPIHTQVSSCIHSLMFNSSQVTVSIKYRDTHKSIATTDQFPSLVPSSLSSFPAGNGKMGGELGTRIISPRSS